RELLQLFVAALQVRDELLAGPVLVFNATQHLVEGVGQQAQLIRAQLRGPHRIVVTVGDDFGGLGERQDRPGDRALEGGGEEVRHEQGHAHQQGGEGTGEPQRAVHRREIGLEVERPQSRVARLRHRRKSHEVRVLEAVPVPVRRGRKRRDRRVRRVASEQLPILAVQAGGDDVRLRSQRRKNLPRVTLVLERQGRGTVGREDATEGGQILQRRLPERQELVRQEGGAREHQD